jgi:hypothetical protein
VLCVFKHSKRSADSPLAELDFWKPNGGSVPRPSHSFRPQRMSAPRYSGVNPPIALGMAIGSRSHQDFAPTRTTTPPSGVSVRIDSGRARFNCGATYFRQATEKTNIFECVSIWVKGGWKETRGVQRLISAKRPVSESRMASLNPFEPKRKKAHAGASSRVREWYVAEGMTHATNSLSCQRRTPRDPREALRKSDGYWKIIRSA